MNHGSLFSGIGGFDVAAERAGWNNIFHCEWNEFCQRALKYHFPKSISYADITKTNFTIHRGTIDIISGGFPCQPYSMAGKRKGKEDARHLWPEMLRAIREIQPSWVVGENVSGLINWNRGLVFDEVQTDLEIEGYKVWPYVLPACAVNAPHRRDRVWFVAYSGSHGHQSGGFDKDRSATSKGKGSEQERERVWANVGGVIQPGFVADPNGIGRNNGSDNRGKRHIQADKRTSEESKSKRQGWISGIGEIGSDASDPNKIGLQHTGTSRRWRDEPKNSHDSNSKSERRKGEQAGTEIIQTPIGSGLHGRGGDERSRGWTNFPTESPICSGNDGVPSGLVGITVSKHRNESIKAYGNAIVPQVAYEIFKVINQMNHGKP